MTQKNPWIALAQDERRKNFILKEEQSIVEKFNARVSEQYKIQTSIFPAPFMGDVRNASVLILMLNPGYDPKEEIAGYYSQYSHWWLKQIQHILPKPEMPLFCLDDDYIKKSSYWAQKLRPLIDVAGQKNIAHQVAKIQFFPYHSQKYKPLYKKLLKEEGFEAYLPSQKYNFKIVIKAMERGALLIIPRSKKYWFDAIPELKSYPNKYYTKNYRNPILSQNNLGLPGFTAVMDTLRG